MHRLFTASALIVSAALISMSTEASAAGTGGGAHVKVFDGQSAASDKDHKRWSDIQSATGSQAASTDHKHKDWINLNKVTMIRWAPGIESRNVKVRGRIRPDAASGRPTGKRQHKPITVIKPIDKASPLLARAARTGRPLPEVVLVARNTDPQTAGRVPYYRYKLQNVQVVNYQTGGGAGDTPPTETMSLNFSR